MAEGDVKSCVGCRNTLTPPYIHCVECTSRQVDLCLHCFARGFESKCHHSDHRYTVIKYDFSLFDPDWTGTEELKLLEAMAECGVGNWMDVAHMMQTKSHASCEYHYNKYYLENPVQPLPEMPAPDRHIFPSVVAFKPSEDPPRPEEGSTLQSDMAGYMPARGDFAVEPDNFAEMDLQDISFREMPKKNDELVHELNYQAVDVYRNVLRERTRMKRIIKQCGLINVKKMIQYNRVYEQTIGQSHVDSMRVFNRLLDQMDWDKYNESYHYEVQLKKGLLKLQEYRRAGITSFRMARIYDFLKERRNRQRGQLHALSDVLQNLENKWSCNQWLRKQALMNRTSGGELPGARIPVMVRRPTLPLDIVGLPGYDKLSEKERLLCSAVRLVPESYLEFKNILITECFKGGFLRLAHARTLIKIDVNKTRKIYDFLVEEGDINKEPIT